MRTPRIILIVTYLLAFLVRLLWMLKVHHPLHAVYSDMGGYVDRAEQLMWHLPTPDPRVLDIYPWGAHALYALEFTLLGRHAEVPIAIAQALVGAVPAPCIASMSMRLMPSRWIALFTGVLVAFWFPQVWVAAFFLSEHWFSAGIAAYSALSVKGRTGALGLLGRGLIAAITFVVRPQFILTWALDMARVAIGRVRRAGLRGAVVTVTLLTLPVAIFLGGSAIRLHKLSGHWGLISENDQMTLIWAETDICQLKSHWTLPDGGNLYYWFNPPSKPAQKPSDIVEFEGFISDPVILKRIRLERTRGEPLIVRVRRKFHNVGLLFTGNLPWPESNFHEPVWRRKLQEGFATATLYVVLPLAALGVLLGRRNAALFVAAAQTGTCIFAAAFFFGEGRYHVPYDPFFLLLATVGMYEVVRRVGGRIHRWQLRRLARRAQRASEAPPPSRVAIAPGG